MHALLLIRTVLQTVDYGLWTRDSWIHAPVFCAVAQNVSSVEWHRTAKLYPVHRLHFHDGEIAELSTCINKVSGLAWLGEPNEFLSLLLSATYGPGLEHMYDARRVWGRKELLEEIYLFAYCVSKDIQTSCYDIEFFLYFCKTTRLDYSRCKRYFEHEEHAHDSDDLWVFLLETQLLFF